MYATKPEYQGPDRRRRRVYVTQNHEYHCKDGICVAVRDIQTGAFVPKHAAVGKTVTGGLVFRGGGIESLAPPDKASPGQRMHFAQGSEDRSDVLTSTLKAVERPPREIVAQYDAALPSR
jgi:hypothetical protein